MAYDDEMLSDKASAALQEELANAKPGYYNRFKVKVSNIVNKCTFGKVGTPAEPKDKPCSGVGCKDKQ